MRRGSVRAVGDVALRRSPRHGWVPGGHWDGALRGPAALVADLLGSPGDAVTDVAPYVFSTQLGHELALFGRPHTDDEVVLRGDPAGGEGWARPVVPARVPTRSARSSRSTARATSAPPGGCSPRRACPGSTARWRSTRGGPCGRRPLV